MLYSILVAIDVLLAIAIIGLVLIQHGKGADAGAAFGSGASGTVFGAQGSASFLTKITTVLAVLFFVNSLWLAHLASNRPVAESVIDTVEETTVDNSEADVSNTDVPETNDVPTTEMSNDLPSDVPDDLPSQPQENLESIKEEVKGALEEVTPDDVPE